MPILGGDIEISSSIHVTICLFGGKTNGRFSLKIIKNFCHNRQIRSYVLVPSERISMPETELPHKASLAHITT